MARRLDTDALSVVDTALGLSGGSTVQATEFNEDILDQALDVGALIRRGRTLAGTQGIFRGIIRTVHPGAGTINAAIAPYAAGVANVVAPYPSPVPPEFDVWLLGASVRRFAGAGGLTDAILSLVNVVQGFGIDNGGAPIVGINEIIPLAYWDSLVTATDNIAVTGGQLPWKRLGVRIPRIGISPGAPVNIAFRSVAAAAATFDCLVLMGLFPIALGQDGV